MKRVAPIVVTVLVAPLLSLSAAPAGAGQKVPLPGGEQLLPAGFGCPFDVFAVFASKESLSFRPDGSMTVNGSFKATLTNVATGKTISVNAPGPGTVSPNGDLTTSRGPGLYIVVAGEFGGPGIFLRHGRVTYTRTAEGLIDPITVTGNSRNLCNDLA